MARLNAEREATLAVENATKARNFDKLKETLAKVCLFFLRLISATSDFLF